MAHATSGPPPRHLSLRWCIAAAVVFAAAGFGGYGIWRYEMEHQGHADLLSVVYHTLQLFILHAPHLEQPVNWQIHAGRLLSALVVFWALIQGLFRLFGTELRLALIRWRGGHVVICGLGRLGRQLAAEFHQGGHRVVVIESDPDVAATAKRGVIVLQGDAADAHELRRVGVARARQLIAVCDEVQTNVAVATTVGELVSRSRARGPTARPLEGWLFVPDPQLRQLLKRDGLFPHSGPRFRVNVRGLDLFSLAARQVLESHPLDFEPIGPNSPAAVRLVIVGFGSMGQRLALQTAQLGHFANRRKPRVTILEPAGSPRVALFRDRYPRFSELIDFHDQPLSHDQWDAAAHILAAARQGDDELSTVALCWDSERATVTGETELFQRLESDDAVNLRLALSLQNAADGGAPRVLLFQTRRRGFAGLFTDGVTSNGRAGEVHVFGTIEQTCSLDALMHESTDAVARALHENWYAAQISDGRKQGDKPALQPWEELDELYKESNRHAADHIPVKLNAIGYRVDDLRRPGGRLSSFDAPDHKQHVDMLAGMEHSRWCAELILMGYTHAPGPRDDAARTHPDLVPWEELSDASRQYDRRQVLAIPPALERAGLGIFPREAGA